MKKIALLSIAGLMALAACSADEGDYKDEAAKFLEGSEVEQAAGQKFSNAECEEPANTDEGTEFSCTADGADGINYTFTVSINGKNSFIVSDYQPTP